MGKFGLHKQNYYYVKNARPIYKKRWTKVKKDDILFLLNLCMKEGMKLRNECYRNYWKLWCW